MGFWKTAAPAVAFLLAFFLFMLVAVLCLSDDKLCPCYPQQRLAGDY